VERKRIGKEGAPVWRKIVIAIARRSKSQWGEKHLLQLKKTPVTE